MLPKYLTNTAMFFTAVLLLLQSVLLTCDLGDT